MAYAGCFVFYCLSFKVSKSLFIFWKLISLFCILFSIAIWHTLGNNIPQAMNVIRAYGKNHVMNAENIGSQISLNGSIIQSIESNVGKKIMRIMF